MKCTLKTCMSLMMNLLSVRMLYIVESDNKGIPEGNDRIYFEESDIYFAAPEKTLLERKGKLKNMSASSTTSILLKKIVCKPALHMETLHCDESDLARVLSLKPGKSDTPNKYKRKSNERIERLNSLRNKGHQDHNCRVLESQEGELMLLRRLQGEGPFSSIGRTLSKVLRMGGRFTQTCRTQRYRKSFVPNSIHVTNNR